MVASLEAVLPFPHHPQRRRPAAVRRTRRFAGIGLRRFRRYQRLDRREELVRRAGYGDDVARLALPVQGRHDAEAHAVVVSVVQHEQLGREDVVVGRAQLIVRPDHGQNDLRERGKRAGTRLFALRDKGKSILIAQQ